MTLKTNAEECRGELAPVYKKYPNQLEPQGAHLELDPRAHTLEAGYDGEIGNAVPVAVYHGRILRFDISPYLRGDVVAAILEDAEILALATRICAGHNIRWDGHNNVGELTDEAVLACDDLEEILSRYGEDPEEIIREAAILDWIPNADSVGITAETTDHDLHKMADKLDDEAVAEGIIIEHAGISTLDRLLSLRDEIRKEQWRVRARVRVNTTGEMCDLSLLVGDRAPTTEEALGAARFLICVSAPRRSAKARAESDAREGLDWLRDAGIPVPEFPGSGYGVAERIREWFESAHAKGDVDRSVERREAA